MGGSHDYIYGIVWKSILLLKGWGGVRVVTGRNRTYWYLVYGVIGFTKQCNLFKFI